MMKKLNILCGLSVISAVALAAVNMTANSTCLWLCHQPKFPEAANKYKKQINV